MFTSTSECTTFSKPAPEPFVMISSFIVPYGTPFLARLHFSAEELLLYPRRPRQRRRRRQRPRRRPHAKC